MNREQRRAAEKQLKKAQKNPMKYSVGIKLRHTYGVFDSDGNDITAQRIKRVDLP